MQQVEHPLHWFQPGYLSRRSGVALNDIEFVAVDFETTGLCPRTDRIVEVAACRFTVDGTICDEYASRVDPVTARASSTETFHGLTDETVRGAPPFGDIWPELSRLISGAVVVAHNLAFEDEFLRFELDRMGVDLTGQVPGVCTMVTAWSHLRAISYKQKIVFRTVVGTWPRDAHTALGDVRNLSAIVAGLHQRLPDLRYVGPRPVTLPAAGRRRRMFARPIVGQAVQWNSLPMARTEYPLPPGALRDGAVGLLHAHRPVEALIDLMATAGVGASQFSRELATMIVELLTDGQLSWNAGTQAALEDLMEIMASREFAEILTDGVRDRLPPDGLLAPLLAGERWQVPGTQPDREPLVDFLTDLGAHVLRTRRPQLDARVHAGRVHRDGIHDLDTYLKDLRCRALEAGPAHLRTWTTCHRQRYLESAGIPLGDQDGGEEWNQRMRFVAINPEHPPNWRWLVDPAYDERADQFDDHDLAGGEALATGGSAVPSTPMAVDDQPSHIAQAKAVAGPSGPTLADTQRTPLPAAAGTNEMARHAALEQVGQALTALVAKADSNQANHACERPHTRAEPAPSQPADTLPRSQPGSDGGFTAGAPQRRPERPSCGAPGASCCR